MYSLKRRVEHRSLLLVAHCEWVEASGVRFGCFVLVCKIQDLASVLGGEAFQDRRNLN